MYSLWLLFKFTSEVKILVKNSQPHTSVGLLSAQFFIRNLASAVLQNIPILTDFFLLNHRLDFSKNQVECNKNLFFPISLLQMTGNFFVHHFHPITLSPRSSFFLLFFFGVRRKVKT